MRAAAELSVIGGHMWFPYKFAIVANDSWVCVCSRLAQSSVQVMRGRSGPGMKAVVRASTELCLCRAVFLYMRACGWATAHVLRDCPLARRVREASPVWTEKELLQPSAVPRALMRAILPLELRSPCITCPLRSPLLCSPVMEDDGTTGGGPVRSGVMSGFPLVAAPMGGRRCRGLERRGVIPV